MRFSIEYDSMAINRKHSTNKVTYRWQKKTWHPFQTDIYFSPSHLVNHIYWKIKSTFKLTLRDKRKDKYSHSSRKRACSGGHSCRVASCRRCSCRSAPCFRTVSCCRWPLLRSNCTCCSPGRRRRRAPSAGCCPSSKMRGERRVGVGSPVESKIKYLFRSKFLK